ncbi:hypothetical protein [Kitasatospora sp. MMS16-BH015]|nr:hypothetical protein [Kitasatospora sp. MMS16-BH015]
MDLGRDDYDPVEYHAFMEALERDGVSLPIAFLRLMDHDGQH